MTCSTAARYSREGRYSAADRYSAAVSYSKAGRYSAADRYSWAAGCILRYMQQIVTVLYLDTLSFIWNNRRDSSSNY